MSKIRNLVFGCAMGIASAIAPMGAAQAVPLAVPKVETKGVVTQAQYCYGYGCGWERPRYHRRHYRPRYGYERRHYRPRYERRHYGGRNAHVRWCSNRYRTYDPYTNRYHAGGGVYRMCYSPYR